MQLLRRFQISLFVLMLLQTARSAAAPVYLECTVVNDDGEETTLLITVDEDTKKITHASGSGAAFNTDGFFSANTITYQRIEISGASRFATRFEIDRTTLGYTSIFRMDAANEDIRLSRPDLAVEIVSNGICSIAETSGRKI